MYAREKNIEKDLSIKNDILTAKSRMKKPKKIFPSSNNS